MQRIMLSIDDDLAATLDRQMKKHHVAEAQRYAGRVIVLAEGQMLFDDAPDALLREAGESAGGDLERALVKFLQRGGGAGDAPPA